MYNAIIYYSPNEFISISDVDTIQYYNASIETIKIEDFLKKPIYIKEFRSIYGEKDIFHFNRSNQPIAVEFNSK